MSFLLAFFMVCYIAFIASMAVAWLRLPTIQVPISYQPHTFISVLIPVRNEAENILNLLRDFEGQRFPRLQFEVLVLDDYSEDDTAALVRDFQLRSSLDLKMLAAENDVTGKKNMLAFGLKHAKGTLIAQTDGDCRVDTDWLSLLEYAYTNQSARFISGPVKLEAGNSFFGKMQVTEFASLIGSGAASIGFGLPNMCNGANLAFEKAAFDAVNGYAGNDKIASGDDEFLMHKIHNHFPGSVFFLKNPKAIVRTKVQETLSGFLSQRVRWASKWKFYNNRPSQIVGLLVFGTNFLLFIGLLGWIVGIIDATAFWPWLFAKSAVDFVFLALVLQFLRQGPYLLYFLPWQLVYLPYVIYCALSGLRGTYRWKGRILNHP